MEYMDRSLYKDYVDLVRGCVVTDWGLTEAKKIAEQITANKGRYITVQMRTGVFWQFVGALHHLESGGDFDCHLANGDPIASETYHDPAGIPAGDWESCAVAALALKGWTKDADLDWFDIFYTLNKAEIWNGTGYRDYHPDVKSPYLWSGTNHYTKGKYVADGTWDRDGNQVRASKRFVERSNSGDFQNASTQKPIVIFCNATR
jgi:lysozyme family protein